MLCPAMLPSRWDGGCASRRSGSTSCPAAVTPACWAAARRSDAVRPVPGSAWTTAHRWCWRPPDTRPKKAPDTLVEAYAEVVGELPDAKLALAGRDGVQTSQLRAAVQRLGLGRAVRFLGARDDVPELLCGADLFVLPSRWEGLPGAVLEAMALEAPVVASDLPMVREAVTDGVTARLVPVDRPAALAAAILEVLADPDAAAARAARARADFLERFTVERAADGMVALYRRALSSG
jgi:glycosyltransferase involved in cell wall biosynthesis